MTELFTPEVGVYRGANDSVLKQLEFVLSPILKKKPYDRVFFPPLGLFGEASTGKTTCATIIASILDAELIVVRGDEYTTSLTSIIESKLGKTKALLFDEDEGTRILTAGGKYKKVIIFIDEAHKLPSKAQNELLMILGATKSVKFKDPGCSFIFATTDRSDIVYPLQTRLFSVSFEPYTSEDIGNIILLKYKDSFEKDAAEQLAKLAKLVPRTALKYAEVLTKNFDRKLTKEDILSSGETVFGIDREGLDKTDKRILIYLKQFKQNIQPYEEIALTLHRETVAKLENKASLTSAEHKSLNKAKFNINLLERKEATPEYTPKSLEDISAGCKLLDLGDLKIRINYLEQLGFVEKVASKGVKLKCG